MAFASGKHALAVCDRCGFSARYTEIREEWNGSRVCRECYEPKHPQLESPKVRADAIALRFARPDRIEPVVVQVGIGDNAFQNIGGVQALFDLRPAPITPIRARVEAGYVIASGNADVPVTGFGLNAFLGNESTPGVTTYVYPSGLEITSALGTVSLSTDQVLSVSGLSASSALGADTTVFPLFFGEGEYGGAAWDGYN